jgi:hypothetical protein
VEVLLDERQKFKDVHDGKAECVTSGLLKMNSGIFFQKKSKRRWYVRDSRVRGVRLRPKSEPTVAYAAVVVWLLRPGSATCPQH